MVFVIRGGMPTAQPVQTGLTDLDYSEIVSGLTLSDTVLILPSASLVQSQEAGRWEGLEIVGHPTVREASGLALGSRNAYLGPGEHERALGLSRALQAACPKHPSGAGIAVAEEAMHAVLAAHDLRVDYAVVRDARTLEPLQSLEDPARALVAARPGEVRLIDNMAIQFG